MIALDLLLKNEWTMGNGQCIECHGVHDRWAGDFRYPTIGTCGHEKGCQVALAIQELGGNPRFKVRDATEEESMSVLAYQEGWK